jgi:hypothetical protein
MRLSTSAACVVQIQRPTVLACSRSSPNNQNLHHAPSHMPRGERGAKTSRSSGSQGVSRDLAHIPHGERGAKTASSGSQGASRDQGPQGLSRAHPQHVKERVGTSTHPAQTLRAEHGAGPRAQHPQATTRNDTSPAPARHTASLQPCLGTPQPRVHAVQQFLRMR